MFNNLRSNFNNGSNVNTSTRLYSSYSDTCQFTVNAWNENISFRFAPCKGITEDGVRQYAQDRTEIIVTSLTQDNNTALIKGIEDKILPAIKDKKSANVSIVIGNNNNGTNNRKILKLDTDGEKVTLTLYLGVDDNGVSNGDNVTHTFNKKSYVTDYDPKTGNGTEVVEQSDFINFYELLKNCRNLIPVIPHAINHNNAVKSSFRNNNNFNNNQNNGGYNNQQQQAPTSNYNSLDDFINN